MNRYNFKSAMGHFDALMKPMGFTASGLKGRLYLKTKDYKEADKWLSKAIIGDPFNPTHRINRAFALEKMGRLNRALKVLTPIKGPSSSIGVMVHKARILIRMGRYQEAHELLQQFLEKYPSSSEAWRLRGITNWRQGAFPEAEEDFGRARRYLLEAREKLVEKSMGEKERMALEGNLSAYNELQKTVGDYWLSRNLDKPAFDFFEKFIGANKERYKLGYVELPPLEIKDYRPKNSWIIKGFPCFPFWPYVGKAYLYMRRNELRRAKEVLDEVLKYNPQNADALQALGVWHLLQDQHSESLQVFDRAIIADPYLAKAFFNRALAKTALGDTNGAKNDYAHALQLDPLLKE